MNINIDYHRRKTTICHVGALEIGGENPIRIQTMANTSTDDIEGSVAQAKRCFAAGAELLRFTTQGLKQVESLRQIKEKINSEALNAEGNQRSKGAINATPFVADIHFRSEVADAAAEVVEKVRINPGNYASEAELRPKFLHLIERCRQHHTAIRIGVNHGSLSERMMDRYGDTPLGIVESCMEFLRIAHEVGFEDIVISVKASNTRVMVDSVLLLVETMDRENMHYPLHLGVTEAGEGEDGRIKSAVGIGALLAAGIGDTIRVSLSEAPEAEIPVARALVDYFTNPDSPRYTGEQTTDPELHKLHVAAEAGYQILVLGKEWSYPEDKKLEADILQAARVRMYKTEYISCPGCGRTMFNLQETIALVRKGLSEINDPALQAHVNTLKIGIMGCIVNGPGELSDADYGYMGGAKDRISLYRKKECVARNIPQSEAVAQLLRLIQEDYMSGNIAGANAPA